LSEETTLQILASTPDVAGPGKGMSAQTATQLEFGIIGLGTPSVSSSGC